MLALKSKIDAIKSRIDTLNNKNNKIIIEYYTDLESKDANIYFIVKVVDRFNKTIETTSKVDDVKGYVSRFLDKYRCSLEWEFYDVVGGVPTISAPL